MSAQYTSLQPLDFDRLLKLRLVVARVGELGLAGWWGTKDVLGGMGAMAYRRGFPRSHHWAQAKVVFEVARARCQERFPDPTAITLWSLPATVEEQFEHAWGRWIGENEAWEPFFERLKEWKSPSLTEALKAFELWSPSMDAATAQAAPAIASLGLGTFPSLDQASVDGLAAGFSFGQHGEPVVPFVRLQEA